ncbi:MAG: deoxyribose-phosphate aldolase [Rikenellaceae bacterium]
MENLIANIGVQVQKNLNSDTYRKIISFLDATALEVANNGETIEAFVKKVLSDTHSDDLPNVAAICVAPTFIENVGLVLGDDSPVAICSVAGGFPTAHTFLEVKMLECSMAIENGAEEIDVVINVGDILYGSGEIAASELAVIREELGDDTILKVIIESGELKTEELIRKATNIVIETGADFVKTSTGKTAVSATYEAVVYMCEEIKAYYERTGLMVGIKVAGGVTSSEDAARYYTIIQTILGEKWLTPRYFRIGSSSLLSKLLKDL